MRRLIALLTFMVLFKMSQGQDSVRHFEFGATILKVNSFNTSQFIATDRPWLELVNGLFFRYSKKRLGLRVQASYSDYSTFDTYIATGPIGPMGRDVNNKALQIGIGGQFSILKHKSWLYTCLDISYRYLYSNGHDYGPFSEKFTNTSNGADCFLGMGFQFKVFRNFILSPEVGYNTSIQFINEAITLTDLSYYVRPPIYKFSYSEINLIPVLKLHLTVKF